MTSPPFFGENQDFYSLYHRIFGKTTGFLPGQFFIFPFTNREKVAIIARL
jgi:hypothetical protein